MRPVAIVLLAATFGTGIAIGYLIAPHGAWHADAKPASAERARDSDRPRGSAGTRAGGVGSDGDQISVTGVLPPHDVAARLLDAARQSDPFRRAHEVYLIARTLDAKGIAELMPATQQFTREERYSSQPALLSRWLELDAIAAVEWVRALPAGVYRHSMMDELFRILGRTDADTALKILADRGKDPAGDPRARHYLSSIFEGFAQSDPLAAAQAAVALPEKRDRYYAIHAVLIKWAQTDPRTALEYLNQMSDQDQRRNFFNGVFGAWAERDPDAAAEHAIALAAGKERDTALTMVLRHSVANEREVVARVLAAASNDRERDQMIKGILDGIVHEDPRIALQYVPMLSPARQRAAVEQVRYYWSEQNPLDLLEWTNQLATDEARKVARTQIIQNWAGTDPRAAALYCVEEFPSDQQSIANAAAAWGRVEPEQALTWAQTLPAGKAADSAMRASLAMFAAKDPRAALEKASQLPPGKQAEVFEWIAREWVRKEPVAAMAWVRDIPDTAARERAISQALPAWIDRDGTAAVDVWLHQLPAGDWRDSAITLFSSSITYDEPESAVAWASAISAQAKRENAVASAFSSWFNADSERARSWLRQATFLSHELRIRLEEGIDRP